MARVLEFVENGRRKKKGGKSRKRRSPAQRAATAKLVRLAKARRSGGKRKSRKASRRARKTNKRTVIVTDKTTMRVNGKRKNRRSSPKRAHKKRWRWSRKSGFMKNPMAGGLMSGKSLLKEALPLAGGALLSTLGTGIIFNRWGNKMPGMTGANGQAPSPYVRAGYRLALSIIPAVLLRKRMPRLAAGLAAGGVLGAISDAFGQQIQNVSAQLSGGSSTASVARFQRNGVGMGRAGGPQRANLQILGAQGGDMVSLSSGLPIGNPLNPAFG